MLIIFNFDKIFFKVFFIDFFFFIFFGNKKYFRYIEIKIIGIFIRNIVCYFFKFNNNFLSVGFNFVVVEVKMVRIVNVEDCFFFILFCIRVILDGYRVFVLIV